MFVCSRCVFLLFSFYLDVLRAQRIIGFFYLNYPQVNEVGKPKTTFFYSLVVYHHGKMATGGHYTTDMFHPVYGWLRADDIKVKTVPLGFVLKPTQGKDPYVLFYRRTDL